MTTGAAARPVAGLSAPTRRAFLAGVGGLAGSGLLAACSKGGPAPTGSTGVSVETGQLTVSNWPAYIDVAKVNGVRTRPTVNAFERRTGVTVTYNEDVNDNEEFFGKIRNALAAGEPTGRDIVVLTDWMAARLIRYGWAEPIERANVPNGRNLIAPLRSPSFDEDRSLSLPWQSGLTGLATNLRAYPKPVRSVSQLLRDPDLRGRVTVLTEMRDTMGLLLLDAGADPQKFTQDQWEQALDVLQRAVDTGQILGFTGNEYLKGLRSGQIAACIGWSGDVIQAQFDDPRIRFVLPDSGAMLFADNMLIPNAAANKRNAEAWMNFYYDPQVAARVAAWVNYICPVEGAQQAMERVDPSLVENPLIFPTEADYRKLSIFRGLTEDEDSAYSQQFRAVQGS